MWVQPIAPTTLGKPKSVKKSYLAFLKSSLLMGNLTYLGKILWNAFRIRSIPLHNWWLGHFAAGIFYYHSLKATTSKRSKSTQKLKKNLTSFKNNDMKTLFCWLDIYYLGNYFQEIPVCRHKFKIILKKLGRCHFILTNFISYSFIVLRQDDVSIQK